MNKAIFIDRDGTINQDFGYISNASNLELIAGSAEAIKSLNATEYKVIIISNQSGIARGYLTEDTLQAIDKTLRKQILSLGGYVDASYYCPHHPEIGIHPYKEACDCRKPAPGLLKRAAQDLRLDLSLSYMIGDKPSDIEAGKRAGCKTILVLTGYGKKHLAELKDSVDYVANDLKAAVEWVTTASGRNNK